MTGKEMTELFAVMLLAWPNAETFKGGIAKLAPTIKLWVSCTTDVDFWTGQQAVIRLCQVRLVRYGDLEHDGKDHLHDWDGSGGKGIRR